MSLLMRRALEPSVQCEKFPKAVVDVYVTVLESGGSVRGRGLSGDDALRPPCNFPN